jgi:hypothetical protein
MLLSKWIRFRTFLLAAQRPQRLFDAWSQYRKERREKLASKWRTCCDQLVRLHRRLDVVTAHEDMVVLIRCYELWKQRSVSWRLLDYPAPSFTIDFAFDLNVDGFGHGPELPALGHIDPLTEQIGAETAPRFAVVDFEGSKLVQRPVRRVFHQ